LLEGELLAGALDGQDEPPAFVQGVAQRHGTDDVLTGPERAFRKVCLVLGPDADTDGVHVRASEHGIEVDVSILGINLCLRRALAGQGLDQVACGDDLGARDELDRPQPAVSPPRAHADDAKPHAVHLVRLPSSVPDEAHARLGRRASTSRLLSPGGHWRSLAARKSGTGSGIPPWAMDCSEMRPGTVKSSAR